jgi:putative FmdB family regulatory protein
VPTYQYACTACNHAFEQFQSFSDEALTTCPECQGRLRKIFNAVGVVFKGSGFYRTDSRSDAAGATKAGAGSSTSSADSGAAAQSSDTSDSSTATTSTTSAGASTSGAAAGAA